MYKGTVVENSLRDKVILNRLKITETWEDGDWTLHNVLIDENQIQEFSKYLDDGPWYVHFWEPGKDEVIVVFKSKTFSIKFSDKETWKDAIEYGRSIGIPDDQLDFLRD